MSRNRRAVRRLEAWRPPTRCSRLGTGPTLCDRCAYAASLASAAWMAWVAAGGNDHPGPAYGAYMQALRDAHPDPGRDASSAAGSVEVPALITEAEAAREGR